MMKKLKKYGISSLTTKVFMIVALISLFFSVLLTLLQVRIDYKNGHQRFEEVCLTVEQSYLPAISSSRFFLDDRQTVLLLNGLTLLSEIDYASVIEVFGNEEKIIAQSGRYRLPVKVVKEYPLIYNYNGSERNIGMLRIASNLAYIRDSILSTARMSIFSNLLKIFLLSSLIVFLFQRLILRHLRRIASFVSRVDLIASDEDPLILGRKHILSDSHDEIDEIVSAINEMSERIGLSYRELKEAEKELKEIAQEREILIRELYHRTKNNMQVIISLLRMQSMQFEKNHDVQRMVSTTINRIYAMSLVHQMLYRTNDLSYINLNEYISELSENILQSSVSDHQDIRMINNIADVKLSIETTIPIGLVIVELLSNSLKYAFSEQPEPEISIVMKEKASGDLEIEYRDNGPGMAEQDYHESDTLGMKLIFSIVEHQLYGKVLFEGSGGMLCRIGIPSKDLNHKKIR